VSRTLPTYHAALCDAVAAGLEAGAVVRLRARVFAPSGRRGRASSRQAAAFFQRHRAL
jgi:hypothetical protein